MESVEDYDIYIDNLEIRKLYNRIKGTTRIETTLGIRRNGGFYKGQSYLEPPENMMPHWYENYDIEKLQHNLGEELNRLGDSQDIEENILFRAIVHAIHSKDLSEWPHKREGDIITEGIIENDCVLLADDHRQRKLDGFIQKMMEKSPQEIYILQNSRLSEVCLDTHELSGTYKLLPVKDGASEIDFDMMVIGICSCPSIKKIDEYLEEIFSSVRHDNAHDIALKAPRLVVDPNIIFQAYPITLYGVKEYKGISGGNTKQICTPAT